MHGLPSAPAMHACAPGCASTGSGGEAAREPCRLPLLPLRWRVLMRGTGEGAGMTSGASPPPPPPSCTLAATTSSPRSACSAWSMAVGEAPCRSWGARTAPPFSKVLGGCQYSLWAPAPGACSAGIRLEGCTCTVDRRQEFSCEAGQDSSSPRARRRSRGCCSAAGCLRSRSLIDWRRTTSRRGSAA